jgi:hypothetical protein
MNGANGTKQHYECCNKAIDDKLAAEREAKSLKPALMLHPFKITFTKRGGDLVSWTRFHTDEYDARQSSKAIISREYGPGPKLSRSRQIPSLKSHWQWMSYSRLLTARYRSSTS